MNQEELNKILGLHQEWLDGKEGGERANTHMTDLSGTNLRSTDLSGANLRSTNLRSTDLSGANLSDADLRNTDLSGAKLRYTNLRNANLSGTNLNGADLEGAWLWGCIGNMREVKSLQLSTYQITYTKDRLQIGCKNYAITEWFKFTDEKIEDMNIDALDWWKTYKDYIKLTLELSPAI